jgi:hypothetical protein
MTTRFVESNAPAAERNLAHLRLCLASLDVLLRTAVARARAAGLKPDEYQGLYIDDSTIDTLLTDGLDAGLWPGSNSAETDPSIATSQVADQLADVEAAAPNDHPYRLLRLAQAFNLSPAERGLLLIALAPELDRRYERLYSYLQDDVTRRRPGIELTLNLLADTFADRVALRRILTPEGPLIRYDLISTFPDAAQREPTLLGHFLKVDTRIVDYVLGHDYADPRINAAVQLLPPISTFEDLPLPAEQQSTLARSLSLNPVLYFYGTYGAGTREAAQAVGGALGMPVMAVDLTRLQTLATETNIALERLARLALREAHLAGGILLFDNWHSVLDPHHVAPDWLLRAALDYPRPVVLSGKEAWEPHAIARDRPIMRLPFSVPDFEDRMAIWRRFLGGAVPESLNELADKFRLTGGQIRDAVRTARDLAAWRGEAEPTLADLYAGSRAQSNRKLSNLAQKVPSRYGWDDLVLPADRVQQLHELCEQIQHGHRVYDEWGFGRKLANARGLSALFAGVSGTGKTMSADVIGGALGLDVYKIDLSTVVSKYIGETEKNLGSIFDEAEQSNAILFFDEADALFGKRSEVKDAHDRYANIETGYLLQRMESYTGITILATNLRQNLDEAFTRRLDFMLDFPFPEPPDRERLWRVTFPKDTPIDRDVDFPALAHHYRLAGGNIRNAVMASAFLAAADGSAAVGMRHILHAVKREYQKMGKLINDDLLARYGEAE